MSKIMLIILSVLLIAVLLFAAHVMVSRSSMARYGLSGSRILVISKADNQGTEAMTREELSDEIRTLGIRTKDQYPAVASILYTVAAAINCGDEIRMMEITAEYSRRMIEMIKKGGGENL